ncbi:MAG: AAA family ATPase [Acutalibacteraceae bacterium]|nr:AAA family ATPase [Acutalibacteraceae bacterium]
MYKSNINVVSNIYIREPNSVSESFEKLNLDPKFVEHITGYEALKYLKNNFGGTLSGVKLTELQKEELNKLQPCKEAKGATVQGKVLADGKRFYEWRCEEVNCRYMNKGCYPKIINRGNYKTDDKPKETNALSELEWLGISNDSNDIFSSPEAENIQQDNEAVSDNQSVDVIDISADKSEYTKITSAEAKREIIASAIDSHTLVNAGPGTGKTYTAIQRLLYVLNYIEPQDYEMILVICYTRAAVNEIKSRIEAGIAQGVIPYEAKQISVCTFDSLATRYLVSIDTPSEQLCACDYNKRIQLFNEKIDPEDFKDFVYCIVDEIQDLVNDRAIMTINILRALNCGYLLLGDKCQAIYDYDCRSTSSINSTEFYRRLSNILPPDTKKYELINNMRQSDELSRRTALLRNELLDFDSTRINSVFRNELQNITVSEFFAEDYNNVYQGGTTAILCRNNGEAEYLSWHLLQNKISHNFIRTNGQTESLKRYIADIFWDYSKSTISKDDFIKRATIRCRIPEEKAVYLYNALSELVFEEFRGYLDCEKLAQKLCQSVDLPSDILNVKDNSLFVTTIHKAKGREFDKVYLLGYEYNPQYKADSSNTEEERILYVAETRPKSELEIIKKKNKNNWYFLKNKNNRWIRTKRIPYKKHSYCAGFATGLADDINYSSFVEGDFKEAVNRQKYISENVKPGDKIKLQLKNNIYEIIHNNEVIGKMSKSYSDNLTEQFNGWRYISKLPAEISELFITDVITFVSYIDYDNIPQQFRKRRFWLAIEISGFGKTIWTEK